MISCASSNLFTFLVSLPLLGFVTLFASTARAATLADLPERPNIIVIFCDDLGYGDLGCYGHPTIATPHLDRMAAEGMKFTQFYAAASVCTPSRAGLITGRLPQRSGMFGKRRVLFPDSVGGLPAREVTIAEKMREAGYATAAIGKWHLGHLPEYLPTKHGFDSYFGIPYSNDMDRVASAPKGRAAFDQPEVESFNVPLLQISDDQPPVEIERPADQRTITRRYTEATIAQIRKHRDQPFFIYLAHSMPHVPLFRSPDFVDRSTRGLYGDVIEEIDWSVGAILDELRQQKLDERTLVLFTSDNGPWLTFHQQGGSAGLLREGKGCTYEGGMREPALAWWPDTVPAGVTTQAIASTLDFLPTACRLAGVQPPADRPLDGFDLTPVLVEQQPGRRETFFYYRDNRLMAVRMGRWKAHFITQDAYGAGARTPVTHATPVLYDLGVDPGEQWDVADQHPEVLKQIAAVAAQHSAHLEFPISQLDRKQ